MKKLTQNPTKLLILGLLSAMLIFIGLLVIPFTDSFLIDAKVFSFLFFSLLLLLIYTIFSLKNKGFQIVASPLLPPTILFGFIVLISSLIAKPYPAEELLGYGGLWIASVITIVIGGSFLPKTTGSVVTNVMGLLASLLTILSGIQLLGFGPAQLLNTVFSLSLPTNTQFTLIGSPLIALQFQIVAGALLTGKVISSKFKSIPSLIALIITFVGIIMHGWSLLPNQLPPQEAPDLATSWSVALDTLKSPRTALIGEGPSSFINNYRKYKPLTINRTELWSNNFSTSFNTPLTVLSTIGIMGLLTWVFVAFQAAREAKKQQKQQLSISLATYAIIALSLVFSPSPMMMAINAIIIATLIAVSNDKKSFHLSALINMVALNSSQINLKNGSVNKSPAWPVYGISLLIIITSLAGIYGLGRSYYSLVVSRQANLAAAKDDALALYQARQRSVQLMPYLDSFRRAYAITNVIIASGLANAENATNEQKTQVGELLQQAVREARAAVYLDPSDADNWAVLAQVYQAMIGVAEDAEQWTVQAFLSAIETNPTDPQLRVALGGVLLSQKQFEQALAVFEQAISVNQNYANSYYNAAQALISLRRFQDAQIALQSVLNLVEPNSEDFTKVTAELEQLQAMIDQVKDNAATPSAETIQTPSLLNQQLNTPASNTITSPVSDQSLDIDLSQQEATNAALPN